MISNIFKFFHKADLKEADPVSKNPGRGFYRIYTYNIALPFNEDEALWSIDKEDSVALIFIDLSSVRERELESSDLDNLRDILSFFISKEYDIILRAAYDREGDAYTAEPAFFKTLSSHYRAILEVLRDFKEGILVYQGCLMGNWGEMHGSRFSTRENLRTLTKSFREVMRGSIPLAVRQGSMWRMINPPERFRSGAGKSYDTGIFDDAILAWPDHLGSFGTEPGEAAGWIGKWIINEELSFIGILADSVPFGGEVVLNDEHYPTGAETLDRLKVLKTTYLNKDHDIRLLNHWKSLPWGEDKGFSLYDHIASHLGYRFVIDDITVKKIKGQLEWRVRLKNTGFAPIYSEALPEICFLKEGQDTGLGPGPVGERFLSEGPSLSVLPPGGSQVFIIKTPFLKGEVYLNARRLKDNRNIYFANEGPRPGSRRESSSEARREKPLEREACGPAGKGRPPVSPIPGDPASEGSLSYYRKANYPGTYIGYIK